MLKLLPSLTLLFLKQSVQYLVALLHSRCSEVLSQHLPHQLHLTVHSLAVSFDDIRRQHQQCKQKTVSIALHLSLAISLLISRIIILIRRRAQRTAIVRIIHTIKHVIKQRTQQISCQCSQRTASHPSYESSYPFSFSHNYLPNNKSACKVI